MKKMCIVCGYAIENINIKECPNWEAASRTGNYFTRKKIVHSR